MGLDQYLKRCNKTDHTLEQLNKIDNLSTLSDKTKSAKPFLPLRKYENMNYYSIFHEIGYWRKANQIHDWFVKNTQNGVDECQLTELNEDQLMALLTICQEANGTQNASMLPPTSGFFFGSTEVDEWYWRDITDTIKILQNTLNETDWDKQRVFYKSSW